MGHLTEFQEPGFVVSEAEMAPRAMGLRVLARIIARHLIKNSRHDKKNSDSTTMSDRRSGSNYDEGLPRI